MTCVRTVIERRPKPGAYDITTQVTGNLGFLALRVNDRTRALFGALNASYARIDARGRQLGPPLGPAGVGVIVTDTITVIVTVIVAVMPAAMKNGHTNGHSNGRDRWSQSRP